MPEITGDPSRPEPSVELLDGTQIDADQAMQDLGPYWVTSMDAATLRYVLDSLVRSATHCLYARSAGRLVGMGTVVDTAASESDCGVFDLIAVGGARGGAGQAEVLRALLERSQAIIGQGPRSGLEAGVPRAHSDLGRAFIEAGFRAAYSTYEMVRADPGAPPPPPELPNAWRFVPIEPGEVHDYMSMSAAAFAGVPGAFRAGVAETRELLERADVHSEWLVDSRGERVGFVRVRGSGGLGEVGHIDSVGRQPSQRGRGLGPLLLSRALGRLGELGHGAVSLSVAEENEAALDLYARFGFEVAGVEDYYRWVRPT